MEIKIEVCLLLSCSCWAITSMQTNLQQFEENHISPILASLHWLTVKSRICFWIPRRTYGSLEESSQRFHKELVGSGLIVAQAEPTKLQFGKNFNLWRQTLRECQDWVGWPSLKQLQTLLLHFFSSPPWQHFLLLLSFLFTNMFWRPKITFHNLF